MPIQFIALPMELAGTSHDGDSQTAAALRELGIISRGNVGPLALFASEATPVVDVSHGGKLVGHLYDHAGNAVRDPAAIPQPPTPSALREHLLGHFWGQYILIQPGEEGFHSVSVLREPSGAVPCAYSAIGNGIFITSDLALARHLKLYQEQVDWEFVNHCLLYPHIKTVRTGISRVSELLPGSVLTAAGNKTSIGTAWSPWNFVSPAQRQVSFSDAAQTIREVTTSVVKAMAATDRKLLLELSGGLDSSIVGVCLAQARADVSCCTAVTPLPGADERSYAALIAALVGVPLMERTLSFDDACIEFELPVHSLRPAVWALGRAVAASMDDAAHHQQANSLFSGGGGDTVFGYLATAAPAADAFLERGAAAGYRAIVNLSRLHGCTFATAARLTLRKLFRPPLSPYKPNVQLLADQTIVGPLELHPWFNVPNGALPGDRERIHDLTGAQIFADSALRAADRQVRMPLLSQPVMEACLRVPTWMWIAEGQNRAVARAAFSEQLPPEILHRRSKGTFMNFSYAVYRREKKAIERFLLDGHLQARGLLDQQKLQLFLETPLPARDQSFMRVFDLCMLENWLRNHA